MTKIIAISNQKGGVGKSTTAINLSAAIARSGYHVLVADLDPQGNTTSGFGINKRSVARSAYDAFIGNTPINTTILPTTIKNLDIIPSSIDLAGAEIELAALDKREYYLKNSLQDIDDYDYIFIDCPPSLGLITINSLVAANSVLVPIQCEFFALEGLSQLMNTVKLVKKHLNPELNVEGVVLTMYDTRTNLSQQVSDNLRQYFGKKVYNSYIPRNVRLGEAPSHGMCIMDYAPRSAGSDAYLALAKEFLDIQNNEKHNI